MKGTRDLLPSPKRSSGPNTAAAAPGELAPAPAPRVAAAPRQLQTRWVIAAAALVLLGGLLVLVALPQYTRRAPVVVMARDVSVGSTITAADVTTAEVAVGDGLAVVRPQDGTLGKTALADLPRGTILSPGQVGTGAVLPAGQTLVPVRLQPGQRPAQGLAPGQSVLAVPAPADPSAPAGAAVTARAPLGATVLSMGEPDPSTGDVVVDVRVAAEDAVDLARVAATGSVTLVVVPRSGP